MTQATTKDYWISSSALSITLNAMGLPDYIQASVASGAQILVYVKGIIDYDAGHNYRRWELTASPTVFNSYGRKYVFAAVPRNDASARAFICFPSELVDIYGKNADEVQIGSEKYYYINLQGIISSSGDAGTQKRDWEQRVSTGYLSSDEAIDARQNSTDWYNHSTVDGIVTFLKDLTMKAGTKFFQLFAKAVTIVTGGSISFESGGSVAGVADDDTPYLSDDIIATPKYVDGNALSKNHDDTTAYNLTMRNLVAKGSADVFGNTIIRGTLTVGTADAPTGASVMGDVTVGTFNKGVQGGKVDFYGNAEFESIVARSFLEVPELRYNRTTVTVGNKWQTQGAGLVEQVWNNGTNASQFATDTEGIVRLKLEDGEIGAVAVDDKCQGVFHFKGQANDLATSDTKNGNFHFQGFTTVYFLIKEIYTADTLPSFIKEQLAEGETIADNQYFSYELRSATCASLPVTDANRWTDASHPQPSMQFAAYANATNSDRQSSRLTTTTYQLHLAGMTDWTYTQQNIQLIIGWLDGFTLLQKVWDKEQKKFVEAAKELKGEGIATGNIYMWGAINQFDRVPSVVAQQLYFNSSDSPDNPPTGITVADTHLSYDLGAWQRDPITPSPTARFVWQQWLYTYSDGTYSASDVAFHSTDPTMLTAVLSQNIVSVALSEWYDPAAPDTVTFDITARAFSGDTQLALTGGTAAYGGSGSEAVTIAYTADLSADQKSATFHVTLTGFVGVDVDGATPEDAYVSFTLTTVYGTATAVAAIARNYEGEDGQDGANGQDGKDGANGQDGKDGTDGKDGADGNGIVSQTSLFVATDKPTLAAYDEADGWQEDFPLPDTQKPYVWKCVKTAYTLLAATYSTPELVTTYQSGNNANLVQNAAFTATGNMGAWDCQSEYAVVEGKEKPKDKGAIDTAETVYGVNSYFDTCTATAETVSYKEMLRQSINGLTAGQWYTLSFWAKGGTKAIELNETGTAADGFAAATLYLEKGVTYRIAATGYVSLVASKNNRTMRIVLASSDNTEVGAVMIKATFATTAAFEEFTPEASGVYNLMAYPYGGTAVTGASCTLTRYTVEDGRDLTTYLYPNAVDTTTKIIVDRKERQSTPSDGNVTWQLTSDWTKHTLTFKTAAALSASAAVRLLFRLWPAPSTSAYREARVCMPKLEEGMFATGFTAGLEDIKGERGYTGVTVRRGEWEEGVLYRNDSADGSTAADGNRYLDEVSVTDLASGTASWYLARAAHNDVTSAAANKPASGGNDWWEPINDLRPLRTSFADIVTAVVQYLQVNQIQVTDDSGTPYGAFGGGTGQDYPLWFGGTTAAEAVAKFNRKGDLWLGDNFSVQDGRVTATGATLNSVTAEGGQFNDITVSRNSNFYGFLRKQFLYVTADNFNDYATGNDYFGDGGAELSFQKLGTAVILESVPSAVTGTVAIYVPYMVSFRVPVMFDIYNEYRSYVGNQFLFYNTSSKTCAISGGVVESEDGNTVSVSIARGQFAALTCIARVYEGTEQIVWLVRRGAFLGTSY